MNVLSAWCGLRRARIWVNAAFHIQLMTDPFAPLSEEEFEELDHFLLFGVDTEEGMTMDMVDGFLHAIAVGPTTVHPKQWLPKIWGTKEMMPPMGSVEELNHMLGLGKRQLSTLLTRSLWDSQTSRMCRSKPKPTRHCVPSPGSRVAVRLLMRTMVPTTVCRYLSSKATFSPQRKSLRVGRGAAGGSGATA